MGDGIEFFFCESGFGAKTRQPFVAITFRGEEVKVSPEDARALAHNLLAAAEGAETDAYLMEGAGLPFEAAHKLIQGRRRYRRK